MYKNYFKNYHNTEIGIVFFSFVFMVFTLLIGFIKYFINDIFPKETFYIFFSLSFIVIITMIIFYYERKKIIAVIIGKIKPVIEISNKISLKNRGSICIDGKYYYPYRFEKDINMIPQLCNTASNPTFLIQVGYQNIVKLIFKKDYILFNQIIKSKSIELKTN
jgi:hypothetical protein